ncbi:MULTISPECIES: Abi family protein [Xanthomonas]|uniref:Abi family protein n=1 Tax=Xanthomonas TaxID=338 RepID=UPI001ADBFA58|nr:MULTISPECIES: Abi family protein [unclassified Xanthomonas]MBO9873536.1 Abi family protein [Xanthomonas sp. D-93]WNH45318.1 Abi family protein [Xanthomonas sp. A6251]
MTKYGKPPLLIQAQLEQLQQRGLAIGDAGNAERYLQRVGYYRLMGYLYTQRLAGSDNYREQATFEEAVDLYEFDRVLRDLVMEAVGHIEVATRTLLTYHFAHAYGAFGHLDAANLMFTGSQHGEWLDGVFKEVTRSKETFIRHYRDKYTIPAFPMVPIWMATEVMSLGSLSRFYKALRTNEQKAIAREVQLAPPVFANWLHVTTVARNVVAHHGRLWNKELGVSAMRPRAAGWSESEAPFPANRSFFLLLLLSRLLEATTADRDGWRDRVDAHLKGGLTNSARVTSLGAADGWLSHRLWRA